MPAIVSWRQGTRPASTRRNISEVVRATFRPEHINFITLARQAARPGASRPLAAE
jgi:hypothetical protein